MYASGDRTVEPETGQMCPNGGVEDVGRRVVLARSAEHRRNIDTGDVRFSHTGYDVGRTLRVPRDPSALLAHRFGDADGQLACGVLVGRFDHHPNHLFGSGGPQQDSAGVAQLGLGLGNG